MFGIICHFFRLVWENISAPGGRHASFSAEMPPTNNILATKGYGPSYHYALRRYGYVATLIRVRFGGTKTTVVTSPLLEGATVHQARTMSAPGIFFHHF